MKDCYDVLLPVINRTVILSLENATVPSNFKKVVLDLIVKKESR